MMLDAALWEALQQHGVTNAHLDMLLRLLETQRNGSCAWHFVHGQLAQCDMRLTVSARTHDVVRATEAMVDRNTLPHHAK